VGPKVIYETTGYRPLDGMYSKDMASSRLAFSQYWDFWRQMGYDTASIEFLVTDILPGGGALGRHQPGAIKSREDFDRYPWDSLEDAFFERYAPYIKNLTDTCPPGMKAVGGVGNGVFECVQDVVGYIDLCFIREDDEDLYRDLFRAMGEVHYRIWRRFLAEFSDAYCVLRFGDDLGFNKMTLISPEDIKRHIIPQYRRITDLVHDTGRPFLLHSCGNLFEVFDDIISEANIDAKHSNEDAIAHFSIWVDRYGARIGNFGGIDTDVLCRSTPEFIRDYVLDCLEKVKGKGGIAFSSGNSIPDYVPTEGYLAMIDTVRKWRGDRALG
jgi:uroporphyrinogen decarboxylase